MISKPFTNRYDVENTPPSSLPTSKPFSRLHNTIFEAARRRRARSNGLPSAKQAIQQARRKHVKTRVPSASLRFRVTTVAPPPSSDVEMKDAPQPRATISTAPVSLPKTLGRLELLEVTKEALEAADPSYADIDVEFIREMLPQFASGHLRGLASVKVESLLPTDVRTLPLELPMIIQDTKSAELPTHLMAVYSSEKSATNSVTLFPVHAIVLAAYCARLPPLRRSVNAVLSNAASNDHILAPVVPLCLPSPSTFPRLVLYLYTKKNEIILSAPFLPMPCPESLQKDKTSSQIMSFAGTLAQTFTSQALLTYTKTVHGLWQNAGALGICDDELSSAIDLMWQVLLTAIAIGTGNPAAMVPSPSIPIITVS